MPSSITKWPTSVELNPLDDSTGEDRVVIYDSSSHEFTLVQQISSSLCSDELKLTDTQANQSYGYSLFSQTNDDCNSIYSEYGFRQEFNSDGGYNGTGQQEYIFGASSGTARKQDSIVLADLQFRLQSGSVDGGLDVASTYEGVVNRYFSSVTSAATIDLYTVQTPHRSFTGVGASTTDFDGPLSASFNYIQIKHAASILNATNLRHQASTITIMWARSTSNIADSPIVNAVEDLRFPSEKVIYDPSSFSAYWDINGNLVLKVYHYDINDNVRHIGKFTTLGNPRAGQ